MNFRKRFHSATINCFISVLAIIICLLFTEIVLRIVSDGPTGYENAAGEDMFWQYDSSLGWSMKPFSGGVFIRSEFSADVQINSRGLRDDEFPVEKPENEVRLLLLGDSVVAGFEVEKNETLEARLESKLNSAGREKQYQVINAGCRGYGTDQELLYLENDGFGLSPDMVILAVVPANDIENNITVHTKGRKYSKPYFSYNSDSSLVLRGTPVPRNYPANRQIYSPVVDIPLVTDIDDDDENISISIKKFISRRLYSYSFIARKLKSAPPPVVSFMRKIGVLSYNVPKEWIDYYRYPMNDNLRKKWRVTLDLIKMMNDKCAAGDIPFLVWMFPLKEQVYTRDREIFARVYGLDENQFDFMLPEKILADYCENNNIMFLSPLTNMINLAKDGKRYHFISDNHFNAAGHEFIAGEIFEFLTRNNLIQKPD